MHLHYALLFRTSDLSWKQVFLGTCFSFSAWFPAAVIHCSACTLVHSLPHCGASPLVSYLLSARVDSDKRSLVRELQGLALRPKVVVVVVVGVDRPPLIIIQSLGCFWMRILPFAFVSLLSNVDPSAECSLLASSPFFFFVARSLFLEFFTSQFLYFAFVQTQSIVHSAVNMSRAGLSTRGSNRGIGTAKDIRIADIHSLLSVFSKLISNAFAIKARYKTNPTYFLFIA